MADRIFVIEALSSGPDGYPYDEIVDIAVCSVDPEANDFDTVYHNTVYRDPKDLGKAKLDYISERHGIFAEEIYAGDPENKVAAEIMDIIYGQNVTSYDIRQTFTKYMVCDPWDITFRTTIMPSVSARQPISLRCKDPSDEPDIIRKAYRRTFRNDPAGVGRGKRAIDLAQMTSCLLLELRSRGKY